MRTVAIDLDDTLVPFIEPFVLWLNQTYEGSNYELHRITSYKIRDVYDEPHVDWDERLDAFVASEFQHEHSLFPYARETITELSKTSRLIIVTARPESHRKYTETWLSEEFPGVFEEVHMRSHYSATHDKGELCSHLGASVLVDDAPHNINAALRAGVRGILFGDYPMHRNYVEDHHERALNWQEVSQLLLNTPVSGYSSHDKRNKYQT